jgi:hypothetical protein
MNYRTTTEINAKPKSEILSPLPNKINFNIAFVECNRVYDSTNFLDFLDAVKLRK